MLEVNSYEKSNPGAQWVILSVEQNMKCVEQNKNMKFLLTAVISPFKFNSNF
jgi:hypothetical protein